MTRNNLFHFIAVLVVTAGLFWTLGHSQPQIQLRGGPAPHAATVVFERTTNGGTAIQEVHAFDAVGNSVHSYTTSVAGTKRTVRNRVTGRVNAYDGSLGTVIDGDMSPRDQAALDKRYLGNNPECEAGDAPFITYTAEPAISTILGYRVVKHTALFEMSSCGRDDEACTPETWVGETWYSPELGCLPLRKTHTITNQETGFVRSRIDQTAVSVKSGADSSLFAKNSSARSVKPTELLRLQAERWPHLRKNLDQKLKMAVQAGLDERVK